ncbi:synaptogyrin-2-like [Narcine bancroftii]|uniref:synaptogyrin-2-like n=1 Tax=Narcine bancroftii TaxID=1343680 RepID=UPI003832210B
MDLPSGHPWIFPVATHFNSLFCYNRIIIKTFMFHSPCPGARLCRHRTLPSQSRREGKFKGDHSSRFYFTQRLVGARNALPGVVVEAAFTVFVSLTKYSHSLRVVKILYGSSLMSNDSHFRTLRNLIEPRESSALYLNLRIFSIIVFGCITSEGYENAMTSEKLDCIFNQNVDACHYGVGIGVLAFFICIVFFALDVYFPQISNVNQRKHIVMADFGVSGVWTFLWFVGFCFLTNQWVSTINMPNIGADSARAAIAFSFFSIFSWGLLTAIAFKSYQTGVAEFSERYTDPSSDYPPYPNVAENYQQPFGNTTQPGTDEYHPPTY